VEAGSEEEAKEAAGWEAMVTAGWGLVAEEMAETDWAAAGKEAGGWAAAGWAAAGWAAPATAAVAAVGRCPACRPGSSHRGRSAPRRTCKLRCPPDTGFPSRDTTRPASCTPQRRPRWRASGSDPGGKEQVTSKRQGHFCV
jgi:hypothetical protein